MFVNSIFLKIVFKKHDFKYWNFKFYIEDWREQYEIINNTQIEIKRKNREE